MHKKLYVGLKNLGVEALNIELGYAYIEEPTSELLNQVIKAVEKNAVQNSHWFIMAMAITDVKMLSKATKTIKQNHNVI